MDLVNPTKFHGWRMLAACALLCPMLCAAPLAHPAPYASLLVKDLDTGKIILSDSPDTPHYPASLTKLMTLYLLFDRLGNGSLSLDHRFTVSREAAAQPPTKLGLRPGATISAEECIEALIVKSANDIAVVVAEGIAGDVPAFAEMMTAKARELGMENTVFRNPNGLPNTEQVTTSRDLATLATALVQDFPQFYHYFSIRTCKIGSITLTTHNNFLEMFNGAEGMKTGYTHDAGFNLVATAERGGHRLVGVILGAKGAARRDITMVSTMDSAFEQIGVPQPEAKPVAELHVKKQVAAAVRPTRTVRTPVHRARVVRRHVVRRHRSRAA
ncbi:MAG TPA: D-alanyl-D-alanine carboxypeptidase family protein [Bryobacteraceae bacterium]|nr:D-alanyl-D-alanine carboxypeptidase family protein [Bryobacteraceae bacterium]